MPEDTPLVVYGEDGSITINADTKAEIKLAIKELKVHKRELTAQLAQVKAEQRTKAAGRSNLVRGRGFGASLFRGVQLARRQGAAQEAASAREPIERRRDAVDRLIIDLERRAARGS